MGWSFTSLLTLGLPSWLFNFSMIFRLPTWLFTLHGWLLDFHFTLHFFQYWIYIIHKWCDQWWHDTLTRYWWHGLHDDMEMSSHSCRCYLWVLLRDGACYSSSSSSGLKVRSLQCSLDSLFFVVLWCSFSRLMIILSLQLHKCLLALSPSPFSFIIILSW